MPCQTTLSESLQTQRRTYLLLSRIEQHVIAMSRLSSAQTTVINIRELGWPHGLVVRMLEHVLGMRNLG